MKILARLASIFLTAALAASLIACVNVYASRNGSGTYSLPNSPVSAGDTITASWANSSLNDIASELTNSLERNGKGGMLAALKGVDGTVSAPAFSFTSAPSTGLYLASGAVKVAVGGTSVAQVGSTGVYGLPYAARIQGTTGNILSQTGARNVTAVRNSAGSYTVTATGVTTSGIVLVTPNTSPATPLIVMTVVTSNTVTVTGYNASSGTPTDFDFSVAVLGL